MFFTMCSQKKDLIQATCQLASKNDTNQIRINIKNISSDTLYYTIGLSLLVNSQWKNVLADINSLNKHEIIIYKTLYPSQEVIKLISKHDIHLHFNYFDFAKVRFGIAFNRREEDKEIIIVFPPNGI